MGWLAYSYITLDLFVFFANAPGVSILFPPYYIYFSIRINFPILVVPFQLMISIWLNIGAMKLQYYEEIIKYSSVRVTEVRTEGGTGTGEDDHNKPESVDGDEDNNLSNGGTCLLHSPPSLTSHECKLLQIVIIWMVILSTTSLIPINNADMKFVIGVAVNLNLIFFYAAPLSSIVTILQSKSSASIHFWTMIMMAANAFFWCVYSLAIKDYYILIPNGIGLVFGIIQIILWLLYPTGGDDNDDSEDSTAGIFTEVI